MMPAATWSFVGRSLEHRGPSENARERVAQFVRQRCEKIVLRTRCVLGFESRRSFATQQLFAFPLERLASGNVSDHHDLRFAERLSLHDPSHLELRSVGSFEHRFDPATLLNVLRWP